MSVIFIRINKLVIIILSFLFFEVNKLYKERKEIFNKFLLERYIRDFKFKHEKVINNSYEMKKDYRHLFYINGKYLTENYFLEKTFDIRGNL